jgi:hypothetical protein
VAANRGETGNTPNGETLAMTDRRFPPKELERFDRESTGRLLYLTRALQAEPIVLVLAWIIHEVSSEKREDALKGMMNTGFRHPAFPFEASIARYKVFYHS